MFWRYACSGRWQRYRATSTRSREVSERDPFLRCLLAMTYERQGKADEARASYRQAYDLATAHNPPAAFARPYARRKLGAP